VRQSCSGLERPEQSPENQHTQCQGREIFASKSAERKYERKDQAMKRSSEEATGRWASREALIVTVFFKCLEARVGVLFAGGTVNGLKNVQL
jgi:hypothetical protein